VAHGCLRRTQIGMPYTLTQDARERACDRHADAPSIGKPKQEPVLRSLRTTGPPWLRSICANRAAKPDLRRGVLRNPATGTLALRRSTWDFWPGPVLAVVPPWLKLRRASRRAHASTRNRPSEASLKGFSGRLGMPSRIVRLSPHGSSLPGGAGLANLPGAVANRIGDATAPLRLARTPLEDAPQERG
jgi:hypothetical protein